MQAIGNVLVVGKETVVNMPSKAIQCAPHAAEHVVPVALVYTAPLTDVDFLDLASPRPRNTMALGIERLQRKLHCYSCSFGRFSKSIHTRTTSFHTHNTDTHTCTHTHTHVQVSW